MPRYLPSRRRLAKAIRVTASSMEAVSKTTLPLRGDVRRFLEQQAAWLRKQLTTK